jgi:hypothetical protein
MLPRRWFGLPRAYWVLSAAFVLSLPLVTARIYASDEVQSFSWIRSWAFDRDINFENEYQYFFDHGVTGEGFHETFLERVSDAGRRVNYTPIGAAILWAPFYGVGHLVALATNAPADGYSAPYVKAVAYGSALYGFLALLMSLSIAQQILGRGIGAGLAVWFGTPLLFYVYVAPPYTHACSAFAVSLFLWLWLRVRHRWTVRDGLLLGVAGALMAMVRDQDLLFVAGPALDFVRFAVRRGRTGDAPRTSLARAMELWPTALSGAVGFLLAYAPQLVATKALNGHIGADSTVTRKMTWTSPHGLSVLFSPAHGLFAWTPLAILAILGLCWLISGRAKPGCGDCRWMGVLALVMFLLQVYISGSVESWTVAGAFGQRRFVCLTPVLVLGLAAWCPASSASGAGKVRMAGLAIAVGLGIWWNLGLMFQFGDHRMDRQQLTLRENAWTTFVVLPREAPSLAWRYVTDRASFYKQPKR